MGCSNFGARLEEEAGDAPDVQAALAVGKECGAGNSTARECVVRTVAGTLNAEEENGLNVEHRGRKAVREQCYDSSEVLYRERPQVCPAERGRQSHGF